MPNASTMLVPLLTTCKSRSFGNINEAANLVMEEADPDANIIFGAGIDESMGDKVRITVIATGFEKTPFPPREPVKSARDINLISMMEISLPPVMLISTARAPLMDVSSIGLEMAFLAASIILFSRPTTDANGVPSFMKRRGN